MPLLHFSPIRCLSCTTLKLVLRHGFPLDMLSAVLRFERSYPALPLARQLEHQGFTIPGPLVQRNNSLSFLHFSKCITPKKDRIRTVSQRTKPNSRTAFIGEQPNPWELLHPQDAMHFVPYFYGYRLYHHLAQIKRKSLAYYGAKPGPFSTIVEDWTLY